MVSIITAIYNQLGMNKLFYETVKKHTSGDWELIIIDNGSTDGSREFFQNLGDPRVKVITNDGNYSYPYCQNIGIRHAEGDLLAFLNNDILLAPEWDSRLREVIGKMGMRCFRSPPTIVWPIPWRHVTTIVDTST